MLDNESPALPDSVYAVCMHLLRTLYASPLQPRLPRLLGNESPVPSGYVLSFRWQTLKTSFLWLSSHVCLHNMHRVRVSLLLKTSKKKLLQTVLSIRNSLGSQEKLVCTSSVRDVSESDELLPGWRNSSKRVNMKSLLSYIFETHNKWKKPMLAFHTQGQLSQDL